MFLIPFSLLDIFKTKTETLNSFLLAMRMTMYKQALNKQNTLNFLKVLNVQSYCNTQSLF